MNRYQQGRGTSRYEHHEEFHENGNFNQYKDNGNRIKSYSGNFNNGSGKGTLEPAIREALTKPTEGERILALIDCIGGYRNPYDKFNQTEQFDAYVKCKGDYTIQKEKIKQIIRKVEFEKSGQ